MGTRFPDQFIYQGFMAPCRFEGDIYELEVEGGIPAELNGVFYRVGPDPFLPPRLGKDIAFNGDGMVTSFTFENGHVDFKCRYARTTKYLLERQARKALFGAYRNPFTDDPAVAGQIRGTANTGIVLHGGKLFALKEDSPPLAMDPLSLETTGYYDFGGKLISKTFTAHPKVDPGTGELLAFGYAAKGETTRDIAYYVISPEGEIVHEAWFQAPYSAMVHDFVITDEYVAFPIAPITSDLERLKAGGSHFMFDESKDVQIGVLPRRGKGGEVRWFHGPSRFAAHFVNGFQEGRKLHIDGPVAMGNAFPFFPDINGKPFDEQKSLCRLSRWTVDLDSNDDGFTQAELSPAVGEFPIMDGRFTGRQYTYAFMLVQNPDKAFAQGQKMMFNTLARINVRTGATDYYTGKLTEVFQEPIFIPKSETASEGDGYLAMIVTLLDEQRSDLLLIDASDIAAGPIATVRLPIRLRPGLHGFWASRNYLDEQLRRVISQ